LGKITVYGKALVLEVPDIADLLCVLAPYLIFWGGEELCKFEGRKSVLQGTGRFKGILI
jgi:hypothetical protein